MAMNTGVKEWRFVSASFRPKASSNQFEANPPAKYLGGATPPKLFKGRSRPSGEVMLGLNIGLFGGPT